MHCLEVWAKGLLAAAIAGAASGVITGFAAVGIDPGHFNLQAGLKPTLAIAGVSATVSALISVAAYLKQSPLPPETEEGIMPVIGTTAYNTAGQITLLVRSLLNDAAGNLFTDGLLMPYLNSAYRKVQRALENIQSGSQLSDDALLLVPAIQAVDPAARVAITDASQSSGQLPSDLLVPLRLWERPYNSSADFVEMADLSNHGGLPSESQGPSLRFWEWRADGIYLLGATQDTQVRLRYRKAFPDLIDAASPVLIRNAQEALGFFTAALASAARGAPQALRWDAAGADALEDLLVRATQREQYSGRRRRPYTWRA